jgi:hypothetical protein
MAVARLQRRLAAILSADVVGTRASILALWVLHISRQYRPCFELMVIWVLHRRLRRRNRKDIEDNHLPLSIVRLSTKRIAIGRPATAPPMSLLKCNGVQRASVAFTASR